MRGGHAHDSIEIVIQRAVAFLEGSHGCQAGEMSRPGQRVCAMITQTS